MAHRPLQPNPKTRDDKKADGFLNHPPSLVYLFREEKEMSLEQMRVEKPLCDHCVHVLVKFEQPLVAVLPEDQGNLEGMLRTRLKDRRESWQYANMIAAIHSELGEPDQDDPLNRYSRGFKKTLAGNLYWGAGNWITNIADAVFAIVGIRRDVTKRRLFIDPGKVDLLRYVYGIGFMTISEPDGLIEHTVPPNPARNRFNSAVSRSQVIKPTRVGELYAHYDLRFNFDFFGSYEALADVLWSAGLIGTGGLRTTGRFGRYQPLAVFVRTADIAGDSEHAYHGCSCHQFLANYLRQQNGNGR